MKRMIWTIVYREDSKSPQQEAIKYTAEAANTYARVVIEQGGVAMVIEGDEDIPDDDSSSIPHDGHRSVLKW